MRFFKNILVIAFLTSCARAPIKSLDQAMRPAKTTPIMFTDDLGYGQLAEAIKANIQHLKKTGSEDDQLHFGPRLVSKKLYIENLEVLHQSLLKDPSGKSFIEEVKIGFDIYEVYGDKKWGQVFITSYFDPILKASKKKTEKFSQPLYSTPKDLVRINMGQFAERLPLFESFKGKVTEQKSRDAIVRGRIIPPEKESPLSPLIVPYYDRSEIDVKESPLNKKLILAWVDPIEAFFLHIQGSGLLEFSENKKMRVGYASQNGHPYVPIGRFLLEVIPKEEMSLQKIESYLRSLEPEESQEILNENPSYIFFQQLKGKSLTYFGSEVNAGRTIATDYQYFPKGALAFLEYEKPIFENEDDIAPKEWVPSSRFVIDQDTGGAIRGPHRVDLYWGQGREAKQVAGVMKNPGRLYYFVPKEVVVIK